MAYDLGKLETTKADKPPRLLIYGPPGLGKTTLASEFPSPIILDVEDGVPSDVSLSTFGRIETFPQVMDAVAALYQDKHDFKTLIVDSLDRLEPLVWSAVCTDNKWQSIEDPGYGRGYVEADKAWAKLIDACNYLRNDRGMTIVYIAHSVVNTFDDPSTASYSTYDIRLHKRAKAIVQDEVDAIAFLNRDVVIKSEETGFNKTKSKADGGSTRWLHLEGRPSFTAKNRMGMPERMMVKKGEGYAALKPFLPTHTEQSPVKTTAEDKAENKDAA